MRKQFLAIVVVAAAMALGASTASATSPDLPHNDLDSGNWASVAVSDESSSLSCEIVPCEFDSGSTEWQWHSNPNSPYTAWGDTCQGSIAGSVQADGTVEITNATLDGGLMMCPNNEPGELAWAGQMCEYGPTGEVWLRQNIALDPIGAGVTFGEFIDNYGGNDTLVFDWADSGIGAYGSAGNHLHDADFDMGYQLDVNSPDEPSACGWPELEA